MADVVTNGKRTQNASSFGCRFCAISTGAVNERVWRVPRWPLFAFRSSRASNTIVVAWHDHRASFRELDVEEARELLTGALHVAIEMGLDDYRLVANVGREGGQRVMHAHVLLVEPE